MQKAIQLAKNVKLLVLDVDGVLSDGQLYYGNDGNEFKAFSTQDGLGIKLLQKSGVQVAIITGRQSSIVGNRAKELGINELVQGREDKLIALKELAKSLGLETDELAYMGDDLPDLSAIRYAGMGMTVANAHHVVAQHADWQSQMQGGRGAVREACEFILAAQGNLDEAFSPFL